MHNPVPEADILCVGEHPDTGSGAVDCAVWLIHGTPYGKPSGLET